MYVNDFVVRADTPYARLGIRSSGGLGTRPSIRTPGTTPRSASIAGRLADQVKGPYVRQRAVIQAVLDGEADAGDPALDAR